MKYTVAQYKRMAEKFNKLGLEGKLLLIKIHPDIFRLDLHKEDWYMFRLQEDEAMVLELDFLFEMPNELTEEQLKDIKI
jgi:hypothetical protein